MSQVAVSNRFERIRSDAAFAVRQLRSARSFAAAAIATLAIGIGATAPSSVSSKPSCSGHFHSRILIASSTRTRFATAYRSPRRLISNMQRGAGSPAFSTLSPR